MGVEGGCDDTAYVSACLPVFATFSLIESEKIQ